MRSRLTSFIAAAAVALSLLSGTSALPAAAGEIVTEPENQSCGNNVRQAIAGIESRGSGDLSAVSSNGFLGRYQMGEEALLDQGLVLKDGNVKDNRFTWSPKAKQLYGISSTEDFLKNEAAQEAILSNYQKLNLGYLGSALNSVGQQLPCGGTVTADALLAGAQLGHVKVKNYVNNGFRCIPGKSTPTNDANGTCVEKYMCAVSGCNLVEKDMSKRTCEVTMPMIEAISCSNYSPSLQGFCRAYRPYLMTRAECNDAERMSQSARFGPNREQCENLSFGVGSGSWSFVLACSYAGDFVADQDGQTNPPGPVSDPACIETLRGMGVEFDVLGQVYNGSYGGRTCVIDNAVSLRGTAIPFGAKLTMTCDMAVAMERWGQQLKSIGVTGYYGIGSTRECGPMRDKNGNKPGTITEHALGRAVDVSGVIVDGRKVSMGSIHAPITPDGVIAVQAKKLACSTFRGVLSPTYVGYIGKYVHFHVEWGALNKCL